MSNFKRQSENIKPATSNFTKLTKTGAYTGHFTKVYEKSSKSSKSLALHIEFVADTGETANIDLWHTGRNGDNLDKNGNNLNGFVQVMELMTILELNDLRSKQAPVDIWDWDLKQNVSTVVKAYPQLVEKQVGVVFQAVKNAKQVSVDGVWKTAYPLQYFDNVEQIKFFNAETRQTAYETEHDIDAVEIDKIVDRLPDVKWPKEAQEEDKQIEKKAEIQQPTATYGGFDEDDYTPF